MRPIQNRLVENSAEQKRHHAEGADERVAFLVDGNERVLDGIDETHRAGFIVPRARSVSGLAPD